MARNQSYLPKIFLARATSLKRFPPKISSLQATKKNPYSPVCSVDNNLSVCDKKGRMSVR